MNIVGAISGLGGSTGMLGARRPVVVYGTIMMVLLVVYCAAIGIHGFLRQSDETRADLASNAELGARALDNYFGKLDFALRALTEAIGKDVGHRDGDLSAFKTRASNLLTQFYHFQPELANVVLVMADGQIVASPNLEPDSGPVFVSGGDSFKKFMSRKQAGLDVGQAIYGKVAKSWIVPVRYGVYDQNSELLYFVTASLSVEFIVSFWKDAPVVAKASLGIFRDDGFLLSRYPNAPTADVEKLYGTVQNGPLITFLRRENFPSSGTTDGFVSAIEENAIIAFRRLPHFPLTFFVTMPKANIRSAWWTNNKSSFLLASVMLVALFAVLAMFVRRQKAHDHTLHTAFLTTQRAARERDVALRAMSQGLCVFDREQKLIVCNDVYRDLYGLSENQTKPGTTFQAIQESQIASGNVNKDSVDDIQRRIADVSDSKAYTTINQLSDGRFVSVIHQPIAGGGWVATHEDITERKLAESRIEQLAHYDALTNLANRHLFQERLEQLLTLLRRNGEGFSLFLLDLDRFKAVNDAFGHYAGDALLKEVSTRIKGTLKSTDLAARLGGDEFAMLVSAGQGSLADGPATLAARLSEIVSAPYEIEGQKVVIGCSIGIALAPEHDQTGDGLLKCADTALYKSKNSGRDCYRIYSTDLLREMTSHRELESELRQAICNEEFEVFYQPIIGLKTGSATAVEALVRWRHPLRGLVQPDEFIPLAEDTGLIVPLGEWVLNKACSDAVRWPKDIKVAINLSPLQFARARVVDVVNSALSLSGLPPERLEVEITEGILLEQTEQNLEILRQLKALGVSISLDDFGVGYSSLSYLTTLPLDKVKIDKSFFAKIDRHETRAVVASIVHLARSLNLIACAEGIETPGQLTEIKALGIEIAQGYLFGWPVSVDDLKFDPVYLTGSAWAA